MCDDCQIFFLYGVCFYVCFYLHFFIRNTHIYKHIYLNSLSLFWWWILFFLVTYPPHQCKMLRARITWERVLWLEPTIRNFASTWCAFYIWIFFANTYLPSRPCLVENIDDVLMICHSLRWHMYELIYGFWSFFVLLWWWILFLLLPRTFYIQIKTKAKKKIQWIIQGLFTIRLEQFHNNKKKFSHLFS